MLPVTKEVIELLAKSLIEAHYWPDAMARCAAEAFISIHTKNPDEFHRYEKLSPDEQRDLWFYFATGWNQGRLFARLTTN